MRIIPMLLSGRRKIWDADSSPFLVPWASVKDGQPQCESYLASELWMKIHKIHNITSTFTWNKYKRRTTINKNLDYEVLFSSTFVPYIKPLISNNLNRVCSLNSDNLPEEFSVTTHAMVGAFLKMIQITSTKRLKIQ